MIKPRIYPPTGHRCSRLTGLPLSLLLGTLLLPGCAFNSGGYIENDAIVSGNEDRNLTHTFGLQWVEDKNTSTYQVLEKICNLLIRDTSDTTIPYILTETDKQDLYCNSDLVTHQKVSGLGLAAYTPKHLRALDPELEDRPYASLLYLSFSDASVIKTRDIDGFVKPDTVFHKALTFGLLGLGVAEAGQRWLHLTAGRSADTPYGWKNQISEGGEATVKLTFEMEKLINANSVHDLSWSYGAEIGYYSNLFAGFQFRHTLMQPTLESGFSRPGRINEGIGTLGSAIPMNLRSKRFFQNKSDSLIADGQNDMYLYISGRLNLVGYNSLLEGQFRDSAYELDRSQVAPFVGLLSTGISFSKQSLCNVIGNRIYLIDQLICTKGGNNTRLTFAIHARSDEINNSDLYTHYWAGFYFSNHNGESE